MLDSGNGVPSRLEGGVVSGAEFFVEDGEELAFGGGFDVLVLGVVAVGVGAERGEERLDAGPQVGGVFRLPVGLVEQRL